MGLVLSRLRGKRTTIEILEAIDKDISSLQKYRRKNQENQKKFIASLILYSIIVYVVAALVFFFLYFPEKWRDRIIHSIPLLIFPFLVWLMKKLLHWHYVKKTSNTDSALLELREQKKQILEDVMENETYKKAKEILEKFDPARYKQLEKSSTSPKGSTTTVPQIPSHRVEKPAITTPVQPRLPAPTPPQFRVRSPGSMNVAQRTPLQQLGTHHSPQMMTSVSNGNQMWMRYDRPPGPPLPRSLIPRERTTFDKAVDYLFGDGPQNRYALICRQCHSHNGMALKEEFEFISFRCCYCFTFNSARKQKPHAPKLEFPTPILQRKIISDEKSGFSNDEEESEEETSSGSPDSTTPSADKNISINTQMLQPAMKQPAENLVQRKNIPKSENESSIPGLNGNKCKVDSLDTGEKKK